MKKYEVEMGIHFTKTICVEAPSKQCAAELAEMMLRYTDALPLTRADMEDLACAVTDLETEPGYKEAEKHGKDGGAPGLCCGADCLRQCPLFDDEEEDFDDDEEDRIDELLCDLQDTLEAANEAMADVLIIAEELKELTGEDILSQLLQ